MFGLLWALLCKLWQLLPLPQVGNSISSKYVSQAGKRLGAWLSQPFNRAPFLTVVSKTCRRAPVPPCSPSQCTKSSNTHVIDSCEQQPQKIHNSMKKQPHFDPNFLFSTFFVLFFLKVKPQFKVERKRKNSISHWFQTMKLKVPHCASQGSPCTDWPLLPYIHEMTSRPI